MSMQNRIRLLAALVLALGLDTAHAATFNVTRADDPVPDSCLAGDCSLREAIAATATTPEADTIVLGAGQYRVTRGELAIDGAMTIAAAGSAATRITSSGDYTILHVLPFGALTIQGTEIGTVDGTAVVVEDNATATLRDIHVPANTGGVGTASADSGNGSLRIENSTLDSFLACFQPQGSCRVFDSRLHELLITSELELVRVEVDGANTDTYGITVASSTPITIEDSTIRRTDHPLYLIGDGDTAAAVHVRRTRFIDNTGPLIADRVSVIDMDEVEFRHLSRECWISGSLPPPVSLRRILSDSAGRLKCARNRAAFASKLATAKTVRRGDGRSLRPIFSEPRDSVDLGASFWTADFSHFPNNRVGGSLPHRSEATSLTS